MSAPHKKIKLGTLTAREFAETKEVESEKLKYTLEILKIVHAHQ